MQSNSPRQLLAAHQQLYDQYRAAREEETHDYQYSPPNLARTQPRTHPLYHAYGQQQSSYLQPYDSNDLNVSLRQNLGRSILNSPDGSHPHQPEHRRELDLRRQFELTRDAVNGSSATVAYGAPVLAAYHESRDPTMPRGAAITNSDEYPDGVGNISTTHASHWDPGDCPATHPRQHDQSEESRQQHIAEGVYGGSQPQWSRRFGEAPSGDSWSLVPWQEADLEAIHSQQQRQQRYQQQEQRQWPHHLQQQQQQQQPLSYQTASWPVSTLPTTASSSHLAQTTLAKMQSIATRRSDSHKLKRERPVGPENFCGFVSELGAENWTETNDAANLRKGKWTNEEEYYARRMMDFFSEGLVIIPEGVTLRAYLSKQLSCDRMRITKKFRGICFGGKYRMCAQTYENYLRMQYASTELEALNIRFRESIEHEEEDKRSQDQGSAHTQSGKIPSVLTAPESHDQGPTAPEASLSSHEYPVVKRRRGEKSDLDNPSRSLLLILGQKYLAQLKTQARRSFVTELDSSLGDSLLLLGVDSYDGPVDGVAGGDGQPDGSKSFVESQSVLKISLADIGDEAGTAERDVVDEHNAAFTEKVPTPVPSGRSLGSTQSIPNPNVLVVDDSSSTLKFLRMSFEKKGFNVQIANNGQQALDSMKESNFDCVFLDLEMPLMDGFSVAATFRKWESTCYERSRRQPICALTTHSGTKEKNMCQKAGVDFFETKPAQIPGLLRIAELCVRLQTPTSGSRKLGRSEDGAPRVSS